MNLVYELLTEPYHIKNGKLYNITIENVEEFRRVYYGLKTNTIVEIYDGSNKINNIEMIENVFDLDLNNRKIMNKVYKDLEKESLSEFFYMDRMKINSAINSFIYSLIDELDYPLTLMDDFDMITLLKSSGLKIRDDNESYLDDIVNYLDMSFDILKPKLFITINLDQMLNDSELSLLIEHIKNKDYILINFGRIYTDNNLIKNKILLDEDLCRIL